VTHQGFCGHDKCSQNPDDLYDCGFNDCLASVHWKCWEKNPEHKDYPDQAFCYEHVTPVCLCSCGSRTLLQLGHSARGRRICNFQMKKVRPENPNFCDYSDAVIPWRDPRGSDEYKPCAESDPDAGPGTISMPCMFIVDRDAGTKCGRRMHMACAVKNCTAADVAFCFEHVSDPLTWPFLCAV